MNTLAYAECEVMAGLDLYTRFSNSKRTGFEYQYLAYFLQNRSKGQVGVFITYLSPSFAELIPIGVGY